MNDDDRLSGEAMMKADGYITLIQSVYNVSLIDIIHLPELMGFSEDVYTLIQSILNLFPAWIRLVEVKTCTTSSYAVSKS